MGATWELHVTYVIDHSPACCILHNMCEVHGELFVDNWMESVTSTDQPHSHFTDTDDDVTVCDVRAIQNALVKHLSH